MKKEITLGEFIGALAMLVITLIGWGISVEVRLATHRTQIEHILRMESKIDKINETTTDIQIKLAQKQNIISN